MQAALTGHLVLTTLHTQDATSALTRMMDVGIEPYLVPAAVVGVLGQRLVRCICPHCKEPDAPPEAALRSLGFGEGKPAEQLYRGRGCAQCHHTGLRGRTAIYELLRLDDELSELLLAKTPETTFRARAEERGLLWPFLADARAKIGMGVTTVEEVARVLMGVPSARIG